MEDKAIKTTVEATEAITTGTEFTFPTPREAAMFAAGAGAVVVVEHVVIPVAKKGIAKIKEKFGKNKPVVVEAEEIIEVEE